MIRDSDTSLAVCDYPPDSPLWERRSDCAYAEPSSTTPQIPCNGNHDCTARPPRTKNQPRLTAKALPSLRNFVTRLPHNILPCTRGSTPTPSPVVMLLPEKVIQSLYILSVAGLLVLLGMNPRRWACMYRPSEQATDHDPRVECQ